MKFMKFSKMGHFSWSVSVPNPLLILDMTTFVTFLTPFRRHILSNEFHEIFPFSWLRTSSEWPDCDHPHTRTVTKPGKWPKSGKFTKIDEKQWKSGHFLTLKLIDLDWPGSRYKGSKLTRYGKHLKSPKTAKFPLFRVKTVGQTAGPRPFWQF